MKALLFEEHSSVLPHWWSEGPRARTVVYLDAHLDLQYVNPDRIRRLEQCRSAQQVAALEKPHDLCPDAEFSYSLENFLYPAARLGLVSRLVWVAPPHVRTGYSGRVVAQLQQMDGVLPEELTSFRRVDGRIEGRLLGLDISVCDFRQLEGLALPADSVIDIDVDYFVEVPGDRPWIDPRQVFDALRRLPLASECLTISRSVGSGFTPLRYRFLGDYLAALWEGRSDDIDHYASLFELDRRLRQGERETVAPDLGAEAARYPDCAAGWFLLGLAQADPAEAARSRARAAKISGAYAPSVLRAACEIRNRQLSTDLARVMTLVRRLADVAQGEQGPAFAAVGLLCCAFGDLERALDCYRRATATVGSSSELAMGIARLLLRAGQASEAAGLLSTALDDDKARSAAHGYLGHIFRQGGQPSQARVHLEQAHEAAPCWCEPLEMLAHLYRELGEHDLAGEAVRRLGKLRAEQDSLNRRLAAGA
jgi:tetratricopeptide (TPR) repeat protein